MFHCCEYFAVDEGLVFSVDPNSYAGCSCEIVDVQDLTQVFM